MTREDAIEILRKNRPTSDPRPCGLELCDAVDMAISTLRQQEAVTKCRDLFDEDGGEILPNSSEMTLDDAIAHLDNTLSDTGRKWSCESCRMEHVQLREWLAELRYIKRKRNAQLTLDELREMDGEPVWCDELECYGIIKVDTIGRWANVPFLIGMWRSSNCGSSVNFEYDIESRELTLYRHKPEEEPHQ